MTLAHRRTGSAKRGSRRQAPWLGQRRTSGEKVCSLVVISKDLAKLADPAVEALLRTDMTAAIVQALDEALLDPTLAG